VIKDEGEASAEITRPRASHVELDQTVAAAYGWRDLDLGHGFHATKQGERYTLSEPARRTVLDAAGGLRDKRKKSKGQGRKKASSAPPQGDLLAPPQTDLFA
jgi:hypothetical protein